MKKVFFILILAVVSFTFNQVEAQTYKGSFDSIADANTNGANNTDGDYVYIVTDGGFTFAEGDLFTVYKYPSVFGTELHGAFDNKPMYSTVQLGLQNTGWFEYFTVYLEAGQQFKAYQNDGQSGLQFFTGKPVKTAYDATVSGPLAVPQNGIIADGFQVAYYFDGTYRYSDN